MVHVALLDDHPAVIAGLRRLLDPEPDLTLLAAASNPVELAGQLTGQHADVLVLDYDLSRGDGLAHCQRLKERPDPAAVVIYSAYAGPGLVLAARAAQADAVVDKTQPVHRLLGAIRAVAEGETQFPVLPRTAFETAVSKLDDEDLPIFAMLLDQQPTEAIAEALRLDRAEVLPRAKRVVGRLRPRLRELTVPDSPAQSGSERGRSAR